MFKTDFTFLFFFLEQNKITNNNNDNKRNFWQNTQTPSSSLEKKTLNILYNEIIRNGLGLLLNVTI